MESMVWWLEAATVQHVALTIASDAAMMLAIGGVTASSTLV
jgi:hypothetical protein